MSRWSKIAYGDLRDDGYIDHFFCDPDRQRRGVGSLLIKGFAVVKEQLVTVRGQTLKNFIMQKYI